MAVLVLFITESARKNVRIVEMDLLDVSIQSARIGKAGHFGWFGRPESEHLRSTTLIGDQRKGGHGLWRG